MRTLPVAALLLCGAALQHAQCTFSISPTSAGVGAGLSTGVINITGAAGCSRTVVSNAPWITVTFGQAGTGSGTAGWSVEANNTSSPRTGTVTAAGLTFIITQAAAVCEYNLVPASASFGAAADKGAFTVKSGCLWTPEPGASWITIDSLTTNGEVHFSVVPNPQTTTRTASIRIGDQFFAITQTGPCLSLSGPPNQPLPAAGGTYSFTVNGSAGCPWTASSTVSWLGITSAATGAGSGTVGYRVAANEGAPRSGSIRVNDQSFTISQAGQACDYTLSPLSAGVPAAGGPGTFHVTVDPRCTWTPVSNAAWITVFNPAMLRSGPDEVQYSVQPNAGATRTGTITVGNRQFTVSQNAATAQVRLDAVASAASYVQTGVAPGEIVYIAGAGLGPAELAALQLTPDQTGITDTLAGTRVLFDGKPAPIVYTRKDAVSAIVPYSVASTTRIEVEYQGNRSNALTVNVLPAKPGIFTLNASGSGQAAALNQNTTINGAANPAAPGEVIVLYATGAGATNPPSTDGRITIGDYPTPRLPVSVFINGVEAAVQYAGAAPYLVSGVIQVNAVIPPEISPGDVPVILRIGDRASQPALTIAVR